MQEYWFFVVTDTAEQPIVYCTCAFMGRYAALMNSLAEEHWGQSWMRYTTFTQRDYKADLHGHLGIDPKTLPAMRQRFDPEEGLKKLEFMRANVLKHQAAFIRNELVRPQDFDDLIADFNTAIGALEQAREIGERWFLDVDVSE